MVAFHYNDGGRAAAGYKGGTGDCVVRAITIAGRLDYQYVYDLVNAAGKAERQRKGRGRSSARNGVYKKTTRAIMEELGFEWVPVMAIGTGCTMRARPDELPGGRVILKLSRHVVAAVDGVIHDTYDCTRDGTRCVYGYWRVSPS